MSLSGRPSERGNGSKPVAGIPADLVWDEDNPPVVYACSQHIEHMPYCDGTCESMTLDESSVISANLAREFARNSMSFKGVPEAYQGIIPVSGMKVELFDLEIQVQTVTDLVCELVGISREEFDVKFRENKNEIMQNVLELALPDIKRRRLEAQLGIQSDKKIIGPNGQPL